MPLPSSFSFDTETDRFGEDIRTCMIQTCPLGATSLDDVKVILGLDCYERFMGEFEETMYNMDCHVYNLDYEFAWLKHHIVGRYEFVEYGQRKLKAGQWTCMGDSMTMYAVKVCNQYGKVLKITDDAKKMGNCKMVVAGEGVKHSHPDWFAKVKDVKQKAEYNTGWFSEEAKDHESFIEYGKVDAFSQAMIARYIVENNMDKALTAASNGFLTALLGKYKGCSLASSDGKTLRFAKMDFARYYPPLSREMQDIVERSLLGGFVWGKTGEWKGTFCHVDYSSSYPYEYAFGKMGRGKVIKVPAERMDSFMGDGLIRWYVVSFDFKYKNGPGMPCISGKECRENGAVIKGSWNKKMREGRVEHMLYTEDYLHEI